MFILGKRPNITKHTGNTQNNIVGENDPKYQLLTPDNLAFSILFR